MKMGVFPLPPGVFSRPAVTRSFSLNTLIEEPSLCFPGVILMVKNLPASAGDAGSVAGWGRSPGGGKGNWPQCSCLENPMDRGAWWATVHRVAESDTRTHTPFESHYKTRPFALTNHGGSVPACCRESSQTHEMHICWSPPGWDSCGSWEDPQGGEKRLQEAAVCPFLLLKKQLKACV